MLILLKFVMWAWICLCLNIALAQVERAPIIVDSGQLDTDNTVDVDTNTVVIAHKEIVDSGAKNIEELLNGRVNIISDGQHQIVDLRGFGSTAGSNTLVLLDGRRLNNSSDMAPPDLQGIDLADVERVEIIEGSAGTLYGNQAVGGVINIVTRVPSKTELQVQTGIGSFNNYDVRTQAAGQSNGRFSYKVAVHKWEGDEDRDHSHTDRRSLSVHLEQAYAGGKILFEQQEQHEAVQTPGALLSSELITNRHQSIAVYSSDFNDIETKISRFGLKQELGSSWFLDADLTYRNNDGNSQMSFRPTFHSLSKQNRQAINFTPRISGLLPVTWADLKLTIGSDVETTNYKFSSSLGTMEDMQDNYAAYAQLTANLGQDWNATVGLRHAIVKNNINNNGTGYNKNDGVTIGSASLTYDPSINWRLFSRWDQNYRFATVDEYTSIFPINSVDLKNQTGNSYELGAIYKYKGIKIQTNIYKLLLNNEIIYDESKFQNVNLPHTQRQGGKIDLTWSLTRPWTLGGDYIYTDNSITSGPYTGNSIPQVPRHSERLFLDYSAPNGFGLRLTENWISAQVLGGDFSNQSNPLPGYAVTNIAARYQRGSWQLIAKIDNLLDHEYNETGFSSFLGDSYYPASGRSFWLNVRYNYPN